MGKRIFIIALTYISLSFIASICSTPTNQAGESDEVDISAYNFPNYIQEATYPGSMDAYIYAVDTRNEDFLEYLPCYCSCHQEPFEHNSVKDCFLNKDLTTDEQFAYDPHGANCGICIDTVLDTKRLKSEGKSLTEIRDYIDENYSHFAEPTPSPYPPEGV